MKLIQISMAVGESRSPASPYAISAPAHVLTMTNGVPVCIYYMLSGKMHSAQTNMKTLHEQQEHAECLDSLGAPTMARNMHGQREAPAIHYYDHMHVRVTCNTRLRPAACIMSVALQHDELYLQ